MKERLQLVKLNKEKLFDVRHELYNIVRVINRLENEISINEYKLKDIELEEKLIKKDKLKYILTPILILLNNIFNKININCHFSTNKEKLNNLQERKVVVSSELKGKRKTNLPLIDILTEELEKKTIEEKDLICIINEYERKSKVVDIVSYKNKTLVRKIKMNNNH